jgi:hypothetical protein
MDISSWNFFFLPDSNIPNYLAPAILLPDGRIAYIGKRIDDLWVNVRFILIDFLSLLDK